MAIGDCRLPIGAACVTLVALLAGTAQAQSVRQPIKHGVLVEGHHLAVWEKKPAQPRAVMTRDAFTPSTLTTFVRVALQADPVRVDWRDEHQFNAFRPAQMQAPVLLVHGDRDPQAPLAVETKLFTRFATPDKAWVVLPGADHAAHLEKSQGELVRTIVWFIRRHEV